MSLASRLSATSRRPTATVRLDGRRWADVLSLSRNQQYGSSISGGEVLGRNPPVAIVEGETPISWSWGYDGYEVAGFTGVVARILQRSYPNQIRLQVADPLWLADIRRHDIATDPINSIAASAAITQILEGAGLTRLSIPALAASGSAWAGAEWVLGTQTPVAFANTTALAAAQRIAETLGYWLYADASGIARAVLLERRPSDSPVRTLRWGQDFVLAGTPERERDASSVKNRMVVRGANTGVQGAQIRDEWQTGAADRTLEITYELIEYVNESEAGAASATGAAKRLLSLWSRQPNITRIGRLKADPRLSVGQTVAIQCALIGYSSPTPFFVYSLQTTLDVRKGDFAQSLVLDGGTGDQGYTTLPPPEAAFTWRLVAETLDGTAVVEVFLDGSGSQSFGGEIVSWAWSTATAVQSGYSDTATGVRAMFVYPAAGIAAEITLTVTDTSSKTGSITQTIPLVGDAQAQVTRRIISLALGSAWAVTPDGGATWNIEASGDATLVPETSGSNLIATRASGSTGLRETADALATASTNLAGLGGQITALAATEGAPDRVWAAVGASLYRSLDGGGAFSLWGTLPATISAVLEDPAVPNSVFVLAGADMYHATTETPGTAWVVLHPGPAGATARHLARGQTGATTWIAYTGAFIGSPLQRVEGPITATWPLEADPQPTEIRAIALSGDELTVYAWDGEGRGWAVDSATGVATAIAADLAAGETAQHALHDPDDPIVYLATFGAVAGTTYKYFPLAGSLAAFYTPAAGQQAHRVGLGQPAIAPFAILLLASGGSVPGGVWAYTGSWALKNSGLPSGFWWRRIATNPTNANDWLLFGDNNTAFSRSGGAITSGGQQVVWRTRDAGATWASVDLPDTAISEAFEIGNIAAIGYTSTGLPFVFANWNSSGTTSVVLWRGDDLAATVLLSSGNRGAYGAEAGQDGDIVVTYRTDTSNSYWGYIAAGAGSITQVGSAGQLERAHLIARTSALGRAAVIAGDRGNTGATDVRALPDYRGPAGSAGADALGQRLAGAGGYGFLGGRTGIYRIAADGSGAVITASGEAVGGVASDPQTRALVAYLANGSNGDVRYSQDGGATWTALSGPQNAVEVLDLAALTRPGS